MIVLDSDVMIDLLRRHQPAVAWLDSLGEEEIILPGFVVMELLQGCRNKIDQAQVEQVLTGFDTVWPLPETCETALEIFASSHLSQGIGMLDALIGQTAVALNLPLYTFNRKHYAAIPNLNTVAPYNK
ncbi:MAG: type II toxin-antitoxin system VapC family toxin [Anaerolineaceae bacterium]|nr:type II toxin-antitoxin system VapC family toxin [Anaerolineaceae bacterium]